MTTRQQITDAVAARLRAALPALEGRVYASRVRHIRTNRLPAIGVYALKEHADDNGTSPPRYTRALTLAVECVADADEALDATLNQLADAVEDCLLPDPALGGLVADLALSGTELSLAENGERLIGCARVDWTVEYERALPLPQVDAFASGGVRWDLAPQDGAIDAEDHLSPEQE